MEMRSTVAAGGRGLAGLVAAGALSLAAPSATAQIFFPPPDSHSFITLYEIDSGQSVCHLLCQAASSTGSAVTMPDFAGVHGPNFIDATGSISPSAIHAFATGNAGVEFDLAMDDTYTVHGGTGPFAITVHLDASGTTSTVPAGPFFEDVAPSLVLTIGDFVIDPAATAQPLVTPFDPSTKAIKFISFLGGAAPASAPISLGVSYTRMVSPGDVFDIGYELSTGFALGTVDFAHTATISFDLPDGVFLTSAGGGIFGSPPTTGVPEPASWALMIAGFGLAGALLRRRRITA